MSAVDMTLLAGSGGSWVAGLGVIESVARYSSRVLSTFTGLSFSANFKDLIKSRLGTLRLHTQRAFADDQHTSQLPENIDCHGEFFLPA